MDVPVRHGTLGVVIAAKGGGNLPVVLTVKSVQVIVAVPELTFFLMIACSKPVETCYSQRDSKGSLARMSKSALQIV